MTERLLGYLAAPKRKRVALRGRRYELRMMTSQELLSARAEGEALARLSPPGDRAAAHNAAIAAYSLFRRGAPAFGSAAEVMKRLGPEETEALAREYVDSFGGEDWDALQGQLRSEDFERLKWFVLKSFGVLPCEKRAREMTDWDYVFCALNLWLDASELKSEENPAFDGERFKRLKGARA